MPIYEFECLDCRRKTTTLVLSRDRIAEVRCARCGGANLEKLVSRFATPKSEDARMDALSDPAAMGEIDEKDPKSMARWMKRMGQEMGEDFGEDLDQAMEEEMPGGDEDTGAGSGNGSEDL